MLADIDADLNGADSGDAADSVDTASSAPDGASNTSSGMSLAGVCPSRIVVQTDWFPEAEHGAMYELLADNYFVDSTRQRVSGPMVLAGQPLGIEWEIRAGGPAITFAPPTQVMHEHDDEIHLGYASTDQQIADWDTYPVVSVVAPLEINPQMIMWDDDTYPDVETIRDLGAQKVPINIFAGGAFASVFVAQGIWQQDQVQENYNGSPAAWTAAEGRMAQQGFASAEPYNYEHVYEWGKPVTFQLLHDAGFRPYSQTVAVRHADLEEMRDCLTELVPVIQQAIVNYYANPDRANRIIVDAVAEFQDFWV